MLKETIFFENLQKEYTYLIGKNAEDNFNIIDASSPDDIWFHISGVSSCHVVLQIGTDDCKLCKKNLKSLIKKGAFLCKKYTNKLKNEKNVEVIYTHIKNVVKTETIGAVITNNTKSLII